MKNTPTFRLTLPLTQAPYPPKILMSVTSKKRSEDFLKISDQFQLGVLTTESSHPVTTHLSQTAKKDVASALRLLLDVDDDVLRTCREFVESGRAHSIKDALLSSLK